MALTRRELLARSAAGAGVLAVGNLTSLFSASPAFAAGGPGALVPDPAGLLDLPRGFTYKVVSRTGDAMPAAGQVPANFDGTAAFSGPGGTVRLVRNHERSTPSSTTYPAVAAPELTYDPGAVGGTSTLTLDKHNDRIDEYVSLAGTWSNCAGGLTPWGTWLTCEETETKAGSSTATKDHGFVFEVDPGDPSNNVDPTPLPALGRYAHEAVVVDPERGDLYLTEDASGPNGLVYRCQPADTSQGYGVLRNGGTLHAMACSLGGTHVPDLSVFTAPGTTLQVTWVPVPDPLAAALSTRKQFTDSQVTRSRKFEGVWWGGGNAHIVCSFARLSDGSAAEHDGQVWAYDPGTQTLTLEMRFAVNPDPASDNPDGPDNITVSPFGGFFLCEDGEGLSHVLAVTEDGATFPFALNRLNDSEFAGACFSPDLHTFYVSIQSPGHTFAITGPFPRINR